MSDKELKNFASQSLDKLLQNNNRRLSNFPLMSLPDIGMISECQNHLIFYKLNYDKQLLFILGLIWFG